MGSCIKHDVADIVPDIVPDTHNLKAKRFTLEVYSEVSVCDWMASRQKCRGIRVWHREVAQQKENKRNPEEKTQPPKAHFLPQ